MIQDSSDESDSESTGHHVVVSSVTSSIAVPKNPNISVESVDFDGASPDVTSSLTRKSIERLTGSKAYSVSYDRDSVSPGLDSSGGSRGGSPIPPSYLKSDQSLDSDMLIVSRASRIMDDDWMKVDIRGEGSGMEYNAEDPEAVEAFQRKQLYLLVTRCIAYAFNTKHQIETSPPKQKLNSERYRLIKRMLSIILSGERHRSQDTFLTHQEQVI